ncbi:hypothetical protein [Pleionea mediterranea]|uniref:TusA-related sulfurtransferase n=1 Tax=Pleionea mediterranea TaxID=523701 RepID=A0A316GFE3_9GAMM|nr:hypothetical protein [Pleionea mediterranea]PWK53417.1 TusA-related sulfurtransferase [Pleionea mediterranea]
MTDLKTSITQLKNYYDYREIKCPMSLVRAKQLLRKAQPGDCFHFHTFDISLYKDLRKLQVKLNICVQLEKTDNAELIVTVTCNHELD